jgi:uncharacterized protein with HEPN domain
MSKNNADYLLDVIRELDDVIAFTQDGEAIFMADVKTQKAVIRSYEVIGEICKRLSDDLRAAHPQVDWRQLMAFRDFLAHNYELIALRYVWDAVKDVQTLRQEIEVVLATLPPDEDTKE